MTDITRRLERTADFYESQVMNKDAAIDEDGHWITLEGGRHVFIKEGGNGEKKSYATNDIRNEADATHYVKNNFPSTAFTDIDGANIPLLKPVINSFEHLSEKYPEMEGAVPDVTYEWFGRDEHIFAQTDKWGNIYLNTSHFGVDADEERTLAQLKDCQDKGWMVKTHDPVGGIFAHEYGHAYYQEMYKDESMRPLLNDLAKTPFTKDELSEYAMTNELEAFAEGFAAINYGSSRETLTSDYVKKQKEIITEFKKDKYRVMRGV